MNAYEQLMERGMQQGQTRGLRKILLRLLQVRFGALPEAIVARVNAADDAQLEAWAERVVVATALAEMFGDSSTG